ncbi:MAG: cytochrome d ubiquinol oxidase subunit II [Pricia sp.]
MMMLVVIELYPVLLYSTIDPEYSITIYNAASSDKSLGTSSTMVVIGGPIVLGYTYFVYKTFAGKVRLDDHSY